MNTTKSDRIKVNFDITFHQVSCSLLSVDAFEETGTAQEIVNSEIYKHKISSTGEVLSSPEYHPVGNSVSSEKDYIAMVNESRSKIVECGNCYGAGLKGQCCNTCDSVKEAYDRVGWKFRPQGIKQCESRITAETALDQFAEDGGCQIYGILELNKASGHFHIAPHKKLPENGARSGLVDFMELISFAFSQFNISHTVNGLRFGDQYPGISSPLDGQTRRVEDTHGQYQYYVKIVPTIYKDLQGKEIESNQYAVTEHMRHLAPGSGRGLPGVYFYYEVSPVSAIIEEKRRDGGFWRFFTSVCAIVGGSFAVFNVVDFLLGSFLRLFDGRILA